MKLLLIATAAASAATAVYADDAVGRFQVDPRCGQYGTEPSTLEASLSSKWDYNCFTRNDDVKYYHTEDIPDVGDDGTSALLDDYLPGVAKKLAPLFLAGVIAFLWLTCWSCASTKCCKCCLGKCCGEPMACAGAQPCKTVILLLLLAGMLTVVGLASAGLDNNKAQSEDADKLGDVFDTMSEWAYGTSVSLSNVSARFSTLRNDTTDIKTYSDASVSTQELRDIVDQYVPLISTQLDASANAVDELATDFGKLSKDIDEFSDGFGDQIEKLDRFRKHGTRFVWITLFCLVLFQLVEAVLIKCKPQLARQLWCLWALVTMVYTVVVLFAFILATAMLAIVTVTADVCYDANNNLVSLGNLEGQDLGYFMTCDTNQTSTNPFNGLSTTLVQATENAEGQAETFATALDAEGGGSEYTALSGMTTALVADMGEALATVGSSMTNQGFIDGALSNFNCYGLATRRSAIVNQICDPVLASFASGMELLVAGAVLMVAAEVIRRIGRPTTEQKAKRGKVHPSTPV